ncbi:MAG: carboxypeptidase regulatory-like domain-containing protein [Cellvibrionaceae bacterium]
MKRSALLLTSLLFVLTTSIARADIDTAYQWLSLQQQVDGGVYLSEDIAFPQQSTAETVEAAIYQATAIDVVLAKGAVSSLALSEDTESLARQMLAYASDSSALFSLQIKLASHQNPDGGYGSVAKGDSTADNTCWAVKSLLITSEVNTAILKAVGFLQTQQLENGSWGYSNEPSIEVTSCAIEALSRIRSLGYDVSSSVLSGTQFFTQLLSSTELNQLSTAQKSQILSALAVEGSAKTLISEISDAIQNEQQSNGSWQNDVYETALAIRAIKLAESRISADLKASAVITGRVVVSGTTMPITNANIQLSETVSTVVNALGEFSVSNITTQDVNLTVTADGYQPSTQSIHDISESVVSLGDIPLLPMANKSAFRGDIFDSNTGEKLQNVDIVLSGAESYTLKTDHRGLFSLAGITAGDYELTISIDNYHSISGAASFNAGKTLQLSQGLVNIQHVLDDSPLDLTGRILNSETGLPVNAVSLTLGTTTVSSDEDGRFQFPNVDRGSYRLASEVEGFLDGNWSLFISPGVSGDIGDINIFPESSTSAKTDLDLQLSIQDALTKSVITGTQAIINSTQYLEEYPGQITIAGIGSLSFDVEVSAPGYRSTIFNITASGYGSFAQTIELTPESEIADSISLFGVVEDELGNPIENAVVEIDSLQLTANSSSTGEYVLSEISEKDFTVSISAEGFVSRSMPMSLAEFGNFQLNVKLDSVATDSFQVVSVLAESSEYPANARAKIKAVVRNLTLENADLIVRGRVQNAEGEWIADLTGYAEGSSSGIQSFLPQETQEIILPWNTMQNAAGQYRVVVEAVKPGSITRVLPLGEVLSYGETSVSVTESLGVGGGINFNPPLIQAGSDTPVTLNVILQNMGNQVMVADQARISIQDEAGVEVFTALTSTPELDINAITELHFGEWIPETAGHYSVLVILEGQPELAALSNLYYVGDVATGEFTVDTEIVSTGDQTVKAHIRLKGVDTTNVSSADPLFEQVKESVKKGADYVGPAAVAWHKRHQCLGCHIQTQSLMGLSATSKFVDIAKSDEQFLYNAIASAQQENGSLNSSHPQYAITQNALGTWSLTEYGNANPQSFMTRYNAAKYIWGRKTTEAEGIHWRIDHGTGWLTVPHDAANAAIIKSFVDLLKDSTSIDLSQLVKYTLTDTLPLSGVGAPTGMVSTSTGLLLARQSGIEHFNPESGESKYISLPVSRDLYDVEQASDGTIYAVGYGEFVRVDLSGGIIKIPTPRTDPYTDVIEWNDEIYISDPIYRRIWKLRSDNTWELFVVGGLLQYPDGLAISHKGNLLVANGGNAKNILEIDSTGAVSIFAEGFSHRPFRILPVEDGAYLVNTLSSYHSGQSTPYGINLLTKEGVLQRIINKERVNGIATLNGKIYIADEREHKVYALQSLPADLVFLDELRNNLQELSNYLLARKDNFEAHVLFSTFRLVGLSEVRSVSQDSILNQQLDDAISSLASYLRGRQNSDGGWAPYSGWGSDPLTTAWVGMALDYTNPSTSDPALRNTITYLLNQQWGDGSWPGRYFSTRLGTSSMVMAYMPRILERLGGLDMQVELTLPDNVELSSPSLTATSSNDSYYQWDLTGVTGQGQNIDFDLNLKDMVVDESRSVADVAELKFANSFTDETITRSLDIPVVKAKRDLLLSIAADKSEYTANETLNIQGVVNNVGPDFNNGTLYLQVRPLGSSESIATIVPEPTSINLSASTEIPYSATWNTQTYFSGDYQIYAWVENEMGEKETDGVTTFTILASDDNGEDSVGYGSNIYTDQAQYTRWSPVTVYSRVQNTSVNNTQEAVLAKVEVESPSGQVIFSASRVVSVLNAKALSDAQHVVELDGAEVGNYIGRITVLDAQGTTVVSQSETAFEVVNNAIHALNGSVTVDNQLVSQGSTVTCTDTVENRSSDTEVSPIVTSSLVQIESEVFIQSSDRVIELPAGEKDVSLRDISTSALEQGDYICLLEASLNDDKETLGFASFRVIEPPIKVSGAITLGSQGRLLVLLDDDQCNPDVDEDCASDVYGSEPHGPNDAPSLTTQRAYLEQVLSAAGWSYTIVETADDFDRELTYGGYSAYALLSEHVKLSKPTQENLVSAIAAGDGLLVAGGHDRRNKFIEPALGIDIRGNAANADAVVAETSELGDAWTENFGFGTKVLSFVLSGANLVAEYDQSLSVENAGESSGNSGSGKGKGKSGSAGNDNANKQGDKNAIASFTYQNGRSAFAGFDLLALAVAQYNLALEQGLDDVSATETNAFVQFLLNSLNAVHPDSVALTAGEALPIRFLTFNEKGEASGRLTTILPQAATVIDAGEFDVIKTEQAHQGQWSFALPANTQQWQTLYLQLPEAGTFVIDGVWESANDDQYKPQDAQQLQLNIAQ